MPVFAIQCVLSSVVLVALRCLVLQVLELPRMWRTSKYDFVSIPLHRVKDEPRHDKTNKMAMRPAKTQISLGIRPV